MNIPDDIVEKAAQAAYAITSGWRENWADELPDIKVAFRNEARAALSAAAPTLMAMAWDEGARMQGEYSNGQRPWQTNPYL